MIIFLSFIITNKKHRRCISYLLQKKLVAKNNTHLFSRRFCRSGVWVWLSWSSAYGLSLGCSQGPWSSQGLTASGFSALSLRASVPCWSSDKGPSSWPRGPLHQSHHVWGAREDSHSLFQPTHAVSPRHFTMLSSFTASHCALPTLKGTWTGYGGRQEAAHHKYTHIALIFFFNSNLINSPRSTWVDEWIRVEFGRGCLSIRSKSSTTWQSLC